MIKHFVIAFLLLGAETVMAAEPGGKGIFPYAYKVERLPNGLTIVMVPLSNPGLVAYYSVVRTGSRDEWEAGHSGFAHFFEHMMFRGTEKYPGSAYDRIITEMGADGNAYTTDDYTCYHMVFAKENLEKVMELESDRFQNLSYPEPAFQTEAGAVLGEYNKGRTSPWSVLFEKLQEAAFDRHTYKHTTIGFKADVEAMPTMYEYSKSFFQRYYRPENVVLCIAGDIAYDRVAALAKKYYANWKTGYVEPKIEQEPPQKGERSAQVTFEGRTLPLLAIAYKGLAFDPKSREAAAAQLLGMMTFSETSEIYKTLVLDEQKVEFIRADFSANRDPGLWTVMTRVKKEGDLDAVKEAIDRTIEKYRHVPVDGKKLDDLKKRLKYEFVMDLSTADRVAGALARYIALSGGVDAIDQLYALYETITPAEIMQAAETFLVKEHRTVVTLTGGQK